MENVRLLDAYEMPVCNAVKKALDIKEGYNDVFRKNGRKVKYSKNMNLEEYISQYRMMRWTNGEFSKVVRVNSFCMWLPVKAIDKLRSIKDGGKIIVL